MVVGWLSGIDRLPHIRRAQQETPIEKHLNMLAIRALTARLPRASQSAKRFAAASHLQNGARGFSTGSDDDEVAATPVVEENGVIASIPIAQVRHCCLCCVWMDGCGCEREIAHIYVVLMRQATADDRLKFFALMKETQDKVLPEG